MNNNQWDKLISSENTKNKIDLISTWDKRELIWLFVKRDYSVAIKQTALGPLWFLVQPVATALVNLIVFGGLAGLGTDGVPQMLFYYAGSMLWALFSNIVTAESGVFINNAGIFGKIYFPRLTVVIAGAINVLIKTGIQLILFIIMYVISLIGGADIIVSWKILIALPILFWLSMLAMGWGLVISSVTTKYRDLTMMLSFLLSIMMYVTPVVYPLSQMTGKYRMLLEINPMSAPIECFRIVCFGAGNVPWYSYLSSFVVTFVGIIVGLKLFNKTEKNFVDVI